VRGVFLWWRNSDIETRKFCAFRRQAKCALSKRASKILTDFGAKRRTSPSPFTQDTLQGVLFFGVRNSDIEPCKFFAQPQENASAKTMIFFALREKYAESTYCYIKFWRMACSPYARGRHPRLQNHNTFCRPTIHHVDEKSGDGHSF
jgi:hypothetical protein